MRPCRGSGVTGVGNHLSLSDALPLFDGKATQVEVCRLIAVGVFNPDSVPAAKGIPANTAAAKPLGIIREIIILSKVLTGK